MKNKKYAILISSCDKFSDLWEWHIRLLKKHWIGELPEIYLVTDKETPIHYENVTIMSFSGDFPIRIKKACSNIAAEYILLTLDDYYLIKDVNEKRMNSLIEYSLKQDLDYLLLYDRRYLKRKDRKPLLYNTELDLNEKYSVNLYPAVWKRSFLINSVLKDTNPWKYEVSLTEYALKNAAKCEFNHAQVFIILDVVRKGKVLHPANRYFKQNGIDIGDRPIISWVEEIKLNIMFFINWHFPRPIKNFIKKAAKCFGIHFYSDD